MNFNYTDLAELAVAFLGLVLTKQNVNSRWLFMSIVCYQLIEISTYPITINWTRHYYVWCVGLNAAMLAIIVYRSKLAMLFYSFTHKPYFKTVHDNYSITLPECAYLVLITISSIFLMGVWIELQLYYYYFIDEPFLYTYVWSTFQYAAHTLFILSLLSYIIKEIKWDKVQSESY